MANNIPIPALDNDLHLLTLQRQRNRTARLEAALLSNLIDTMDVWEKPEELLKWRRRSAPLREDPVPALQARAPSVQLPVAPRAPLQQEAALFHPRAHDDVPMTFLHMSVSALNILTQIILHNAMSLRHHHHVKQLAIS